MASEAEALLAEQSFIKQYRPRFNIRLRDDKSYPFIAISLDEDFPRVYFTRERHRRNRLYFGPYSNAKRVRGHARGAGEGLHVPLLHGARAGPTQRQPLPRLLHQALRGPLRRVRLPRGLPGEIEGVVDFLSGRFADDRARPRAADAEAAAASEDFEQATLERNRLQAVRSLLERRRVATRPSAPRRGRRRLDGRDANAQVFQVRDGILCDRQSFYLENDTEREPARWPRSSCSSTTPARPRSRRCWSCSGSSPGREALAEALASRRGGPLEMRAAERGEKRRILELAQRNAASPSTRSACGPSAAARRRVEALEGLQQVLGPRRPSDPDRVLRHLQPRGHPHGRLDGRVRGRRAEEVRLPALHDPHGRRAPPTTTRRWRRCSRGGSPSGSSSRTSRPTTRPTTRASRRSPT